MKNIYTTTLLLLCLGLSVGFSQNITLNISPEDIQVETGETFTIDVSVDGFTDILAMEFQLNWDPTIIEYVSKSNVTTDLPAFSASSIGDAATFTEAGNVKISWFDFSNFQAYSIDDGTRLFSLTFMAISEGTDAFSISNDEILDANENAVTPILVGGAITTGSGGGGGGGGANEDPIEVGVGNGNGQTGQQICVPVRVANFQDMESLQFSINYDETLLEFTQVQNFGLPDLTAGNFNSSAVGAVRFSWSNTQGSSSSVADNTRAFDICFNITGTTNTTTPITIGDSPIAREGIRAEVGEVMVQTADGRVTIMGNDGGGGGTSEDFLIYASSESANVGETVCVDVNVEGFQDIAGLQYTMGWNTSILRFIDVRNYNSNFTDFGSNNIGTEAADIANGFIRVQWNDFSFNGVSLADGSTIYQICFEVIGTAGQISPIAFANNPINQEVINNDTQEVPFASTNGQVRVTGDPPPPSDCDADATPICLSKEAAFVGEEVCVIMTAQEFSEITSMQFTLTYDDNILQFDTIIANPNSPFNTGVNYNGQNAAGIIGFQWTDSNAQNVSIADDTELVQICFTTLQEGTSQISFENVPVAIEVGDVDFNLLDFNGGTGEVVVSAENNCVTPNVSGEKTDVLCNGETTGSIDVTVAGGNSNFSFQWDGGITANTPNPTNLGAGTYSVTVSQNESGCSETSQMTFTITEPSQALDATFELTGEVVCFGDNNGAITITPSGGTGNYSYQWQPSVSSTDSASDLPAGDQGVRVTDANGCTMDLNITIPGPTAAVSITPSVTNVNCDGDESGTISLEVNGGVGDYTFEWAGADGLENSQNQGNLAAGTYAVTVTDANGCPAISNNLVVEPFTGTLISIAESTISSIVDGDDGAIDIMIEGGSGDFTFAWTGPSEYESTMEDISNLAEEGTYTVMVTDNTTGCVTTGSFELEMGSDVAFGTITTTPDCSGETNNSGSISIEIMGGVPPLTFNWGDGLAATKDLVGIAAGDYQLTVTDSRNNEFVSETITVASSEAINYSLNVEDETCSDNSDNGSIKLEVSGGTGELSWTWSAEGTVPNQDSISNLNNGSYILTITDGAACMVIDTVVVELVPEAPRPMNYEITEASCGGTDGAIAFTVACGDPDYFITVQGRSMDNDSMYTFRFDEYNPRVVLNDLAPDTYDVTITDRNEFSTPDVITIPAPSDIDILGNIRSSTEVFAPCDGEIILNSVSGGSTANLTYLWSTGATTKDVNRLCEGTYLVTITNEQGCTEVDTFDIKTFNANGVVTSPECSSGDVTGAIDLTITDGQAPFTYEWSKDGIVIDSIQDLSDIDGGFYSVKITESSGVSITRIFEVKGNSDLDVRMAFGTNYRGFGVSCTGAEDAVLLAEGIGSGDSTTISYAWTNSMGDTLSRTSELANVGADIYQVLVSNDRCTVSAQLAVTEPTPIEVTSIDILEISCAEDDNGEATIIVNGGTGEPYTYQWSHITDNNFPTAIGLSGGNYTVTATDVNGCDVSETFTISASAPIEITIESVPVSSNGDGSITAIVTGGTPINGYNYMWQAPDDQILQNERDSILDKISVAGEYFLMVEDFNGCTATATIDLRDVEGCLEARSVITPNGDGKNETFEIRCVENYKDTRLEIYSRWGQLVYVENSYTGDWAGRDGGGAMVADGVYFYVLIYTDFDGESKQQQGTITVLTE